MAEERDRAREYKAQDVRQGEIILRSQRRRIIFIAGLVGFVLLTLVLKLAT